MAGKRKNFFMVDNRIFEYGLKPRDIAIYEKFRRKPPNGLGKRAKKPRKLSAEEAYGTTHCGGFAWRTRRFR